MFYWPESINGKLSEPWVNEWYPVLKPGSFRSKNINHNTVSRPKHLHFGDLCKYAYSIIFWIGFAIHELELPIIRRVSETRIKIFSVCFPTHLDTRTLLCTIERNRFKWFYSVLVNFNYGFYIKIIRKNIDFSRNFVLLSSIKTGRVQWWNGENGENGEKVRYGVRMHWKADWEYLDSAELSI